LKEMVADFQERESELERIRDELDRLKLRNKELTKQIQERQKAYPIKSSAVNQSLQQHS